MNFCLIKIGNETKVVGTLKKQNDIGQLSEFAEGSQAPKQKEVKKKTFLKRKEKYDAKKVIQNSGKKTTSPKYLILHLLAQCLVRKSIFADLKRKMGLKNKGPQKEEDKTPGVNNLKSKEKESEEKLEELKIQAMKMTFSPNEEELLQEQKDSVHPLSQMEETKEDEEGNPKLSLNFP